MNRYAPLIAVAGGVLLLIVAVGLGKNKPTPPLSNEDASGRTPGNINLVSIDWESNEASFPEPLPADGDRWAMSYSIDGKHRTPKYVDGRRNGRLYTSFPEESQEVWFWVTGGPRPTYAESFYRP